GLVERVTVGDEPSEGDCPIDDEAGALVQAHRREGPGAIERQMPVNDVRAGLERHRPTFADEAGAAEYPSAPDSLGARGCIAGAVERRVGALVVRQVAHGPDRVAVQW